MASSVETDLSLDQIARLIAPGGVLLVATDGGHESARARLTATAIEIAAETRATVVRFDRSGLASDSAMFESPRPLRASDLDGYGRSDLAEQLRAFCRQSVRARGWLAAGRGTRDLATAVQLTGAHLVLFPPDRSSAARRIVRRTLPYYASRIDVPLLTVDAAGRVRLIEPLTRQLTGPLSPIVGGLRPTGSTGPAAPAGS